MDRDGSSGHEQHREGPLLLSWFRDVYSKGKLLPFLADPDPEIRDATLRMKHALLSYDELAGNKRQCRSGDKLAKKPVAARGGLEE